MRYLYLYVEGYTEQTFADTLLKPHLAGFDVSLAGAALAHHSRSRGVVHRGGVTSYAPFRLGLVNLLKQHGRRPDVTVSTMVDLYALPTDFPGWAEAEKLRSDPVRRVSHLEQALAADINQRPGRFLPYIQLHEYEALLFADPEAMNLIESASPAAVARLQEVARGHDTPELINDRADTAPSKQILAHIPTYQKTIDGWQVAQLIGLPVIRAKCPHFNDWVTRLEQLGRPADPSAGAGE